MKLLHHMFTEEYLQAWLRAFLFTQMVEVPVWRWSAQLRYRDAFALSCVTHPFVWFAFPLLALLGVPYLASSALSEVFAWSVEAVLALRWANKITRLSGSPRKRALFASFVANGASLGLGELCRALWAWP
jgi:hypothetical protein